MEQVKYICSRCKREFLTKEEVASDLWLRNGDDTVNYADLCRKCTKEIAEFCRTGDK